MSRLFHFYLLGSACFAIWTVATDPVELGIEMVGKSYEMACRWNQETATLCKGKHSVLQHKMQSKDYFKNNPDKRELYFQEQSKKLLEKLPEVYRVNCEKYIETLDSSNAPPDHDESERLGDAGQNYPFRAYAHCLMSTLGAVSKGIYEKDPDAIIYAMQKVTEAYDLACAWDPEYAHSCRGQQAFQQQQILTRASMKDDRQKQERYFGAWSKSIPLSYLPQPFQTQCELYLFYGRRDDPPPADESAVLHDDKKTWPYKAYAHCLMKVLREISNGRMERSTKFIEYGMEKCVLAYDLVCKHEPQSWRCNGMQEWMQGQMLDREDFKGKTDLQERYFGKWTKDTVLSRLSSIYMDQCGKYLGDPEATPPFDESGFLNDADKTYYPYKAYAHCLVGTLREKNGGNLPSK